LSGLAYFLLLTYRLHMILSRAARQSFFQEILGASLRIVLYSVSPYRQSKLDEGFLFAISSKFIALSFTTDCRKKTSPRSNTENHGFMNHEEKKLNRRRTQTAADFKTLHYVNYDDRSKVKRRSPAVTNKQAYYCLHGLPFTAHLIDRLQLRWSFEQSSNDLLTQIYHTNIY
jgi:hypothetical protein